MEALYDLASGFSTALQPQNLFFCFVGVVIGTLVGVLPGLGSTAAIALLVPVAAGLPTTSAIIMLAGIYYGAMYGGSTTSILVRTPGEAASVVTALDGYEMAKQGRAGPALGMSAIASFVAGTLSLFGLVLLAPPLADAALKFGPPEYFSLIILGLSVAVSLAGESLLKGLASGLFGLLITAIGIDPQTGLSRYTFGNVSLMGGIDFISVIVGLFAVSEVLLNVEAPAAEVYKARIQRLLPSIQECRECLGALWRGTAIGFVLGLLPGMAAAVTTFIAYDVEKRVSRHPELFGRGCIEGVAAPEGANNATSSAGFVPLLTLGIPTTSALAVLLGALMIHGLQPGPMLLVEHPEFVWAVIASMYVGNVMLLILNLPLIPLWVQLLRIPYPLLAPGILTMCFIGTYSIRSNMFDVWMAVVFGFVGYLMQKAGLPTIPLVIAMILGDRAESAFHRSLVMSDGSLLVFVSRPISAVLMAITALSLILALYGRFRRATIPGTEEEEPAQSAAR